MGAGETKEEEPQEVQAPVWYSAPHIGAVPSYYADPYDVNYHYVRGLQSILDMTDAKVLLLGPADPYSQVASTQAIVRNGSRRGSVQTVAYTPSSRRASLQPFGFLPPTALPYRYHVTHTDGNDRLELHQVVHHIRRNDPEVVIYLMDSRHPAPKAKALGDVSQLYNLAPNLKNCLFLTYSDSDNPAHIISQSDLDRVAGSNTVRSFRHIQPRVAATHHVVHVGPERPPLAKAVDQDVGWVVGNLGNRRSLAQQYQLPARGVRYQ